MADTSNENNEALKTIYDQIRTSYHSVDDFRAKLLGILPLVSGVAIFNLLEKVGREGYLSSIGFLGIFTTIGLMVYELNGIKKCTGYIKYGLEIEKAILKTVPNQLGQFGSLNEGDKKSKFISVPIASAFVYAAVIGAWTFVATSKLSSAEIQTTDLIWPSVLAFALVWFSVFKIWKSFSK